MFYQLTVVLFHRTEGATMAGEPFYSNALTGSISPRCTDEAIAYYHVEIDYVLGLNLKSFQL